MKSIAKLAVTTALATAAALPAIAQEAIVLDTITLSAHGSGQDLGRTGATVEVVTEDEIRQSRSTSLGDYLARLPGLSVTSNGGFGTSTSLRVRGLSGMYYKVLVDGIDISDPSELQIQANLSSLLTDDISRIEVLKGPQSALYGSEAIGGVISITSKRADADGFSSSIAAEYGSYDTRRASYTLRHGGENHSTALTLSHFSTDGFSAADENAGNTESDPAEAQRISLTSDYTIGEALTVGISAFWQDQEARYDNSFPTVADDPAPYINRTEATTWAARLFARYDAAGATHELAFQRGGFDRAFIDSFPRESKGRRDELTYLGNADVYERVTLSWGATHSDETARFNAGTARHIMNSAFAEARIAVTPDLDGSLALRHDNHSTFGGNTTGRVAFAWRPDDATVVRAQYGTGFRAPSLNELYGDFGANPNLKPETSRGYDIGVEREFAGGAVVKATWFDNRIEDLIRYTSSYVQVSGESRTRGVELTAAAPINDRLLVGANATYTKATDEDGNPLARVPARSLNVNLSYDVTPATTLSGALRLGSGSYDDRRQKMESWTVVNVTVEHRLSDNAEAYLRIENLFDEEYQVIRGYGTSDRAAYVGLRASF